MYEILVSVGVILAFMMGLLLLVLPDDIGWRIAFAIPCFFAVLQSIGMYMFMPESPKWLMDKGRVEEATSVFVLIYGSVDAFPADIVKDLDEARHEYSGTEASSPSSTADSEATRNPLVAQQMQGKYERDSLNVDKLSGGTCDGKELDQNSARCSADSQTHKSLSKENSKHSKSSTIIDDAGMLEKFKYSVYIVSAIQILAQITGGVVIRNYSPIIFENNGISRARALLFNVILGAVKLLSTVASVSIIEDFGRLKLLEYGAMLVGVGMLFLTLASAASVGGNLNSPIVFLVGAGLCLGGYGIGFGPISWVLSAEMFPTAIRGSVMAISLLVSNLSQLFTNFVFLPAADVFTVGGVFAFFLVMNGFCVLFIRGVLVETKQQDPYAILDALNQKWTLSAEYWRSSTLGKACCCMRGSCGRSTFTPCPSGDNPTL